MDSNPYVFDQLKKRLFKELFTIYNDYRYEMQQDPNISFDLYHRNQIAEFIPQLDDYYNDDDYPAAFVKFLKETNLDEFDVSKPYFLYENGQIISITHAEAFSYIGPNRQIIEDIKKKVESDDDYTVTKETVEAVIDDILNEYDYGGGEIEELGEDPYNNETTFIIHGPHGSNLFINIQLSDYIRDQEDVRNYILQEIRAEAYDFDVDERFDLYYHKNGIPFPPSVFVDYLKEDKAYFDRI